MIFVLRLNSEHFLAWKVAQSKQHSLLIAVQLIDCLWKIYLSILLTFPVNDPLLSGGLYERLVFDTVPVAVTLSQLGCESVSSREDLRVHVRAMVKQDLPKRYHFSNSRRIDDIVVDIDDEFAAVRYVINWLNSSTSSKSLIQHYHHYCSWWICNFDG